MAEGPEVARLAGKSPEANPRRGGPLKGGRPRLHTRAAPLASHWCGATGPASGVIPAAMTALRVPALGGDTRPRWQLAPQWPEAGSPDCHAETRQHRCPQDRGSLCHRPPHLRVQCPLPTDTLPPQGPLGWLWVPTRTQCHQAPPTGLPVCLALGPSGGLGRPVRGPV